MLGLIVFAVIALTTSTAATAVLSGATVAAIVWLTAAVLARPKS